MPESKGSTDDIYSSILTQGELAEISTRKIRLELPLEATRWSKHELAEMATQKTSAVRISETISEKSITAEPVLDKPAHPIRAFWLSWYTAFKKILPVYVAVHLAFVHAHAVWGRFMAVPGYNMIKSMWAIYNHGLMSFTTMRSLTDLLPDLLLGILILLCFIGKWRLPPRLWSYGLYALALYTYFQIFTKSGNFPLESMSRFLLELFPAFVILSNIRRNRLLHLSYFMLALAVFFFLSTQFATGHWVL